jgi:O-antigen/teichoic acid export membrane protein
MQPDQRDYWVDNTRTLPLPILDAGPVIRQRPVQQPPGQTPDPENQGPVARVIAGLRDPAYRGSYALVANTVGTSVIGALYWAVAAHLYTPEELGRATALISALLLVATLSQLNLSSTLMRFLPQMGASTARRLINSSYLISTVTALAGSAIFITLMPRLSSEWSFVGHSAFFAIIFAASVIVWEIFTLQDAALVGLQRAGAVPVENVIYSVAKLGLLVAGVWMLGSTNILFSWVIPLVLLIPGINWLIFRCLRDRNPHDMVPGIRLRQLARFASVDYAGVIFGQVTGNVLPLLVISILGPAAAGSFYIVSLITSGVASVGISFATGLLIEAAAAPSRLPELTRGALKRCFITMGPATLVLIVGAPFILKVYGGASVANTVVLFQLLSLTLLPFCIETIAYSLDRIAGKPIRSTLTQAAIAVLTLGGSWALFGRFGLNAVGIATLGAGIAVALARLPTVVSALRGRMEVAVRPVGTAKAAEPAKVAQPAAQPAKTAQPDGETQPAPSPGRRAQQGWPADPPTQPIRRIQSASAGQPGNGARPAAQQASSAQPIGKPQPDGINQPARGPSPAAPQRWWEAPQTPHSARPAPPAAQPASGAQPTPAAEPSPAAPQRWWEAPQTPRPARPAPPAAEPASGAQPAAAPEDHDPADPGQPSPGRNYAGRHRAAAPPDEAERPADGRNEATDRRNLRPTR